MKSSAPTKIYIICGAILILGLVLSYNLYVSLKDTNNLKREQIVSSYYENVENGIQKEIDRNLNSLYAIRAFYLADGILNMKEFCDYANYYTRNISSIQALEWVPVIPHNKRDSFELSMRNLGFKDFQITTRINDSLVRAEKRNFYYPVTYIEPFKGNEKALGFDPGSSSLIRQNAIERAIETGNAAASDVMMIIQKDEPHNAILVFVPILNADGTRTIALVEGVYLMNELIRSAIEDLDLPREVNLSIANIGISEEFLYGEKLSYISTNYKGNRMIGDLVMADKNWDLAVTYNGNIGSSIVPPIYIFAGALLLTLLITGVIYNFMTDNRKELIKYVHQLEQKNRDLEQYAYVASHDLQEPLHSLQSLVEIVEMDYKDKFDEQGKIYLKHIAKASKRMSSLIKNLLQYSRIGQVEKPVKIDCNVIIEGVIADLKKQIEEKNALIEIKGKLPVIIGYPDALKQLFQNLISNGIKFQESDKTPKIKISAFVNENSEWQFSFKDNGIGFSKEFENQIFIIFKRLHTSSIFPGTGIGLANCKKIVELHYGKIWAESEPGKGSNFCFTLNLKHER